MSWNDFGLGFVYGVLFCMVCGILPLLHFMKVVVKEFAQDRRHNDK